MTTAASSSDIGNNDEIFEINDFTVITDLERFAVSLESAIYDWKLDQVSDNDFSFTEDEVINCKWDLKETKIAFGDRNALNLRYYWSTNLTRLARSESTDSNDSPDQFDYNTNAGKILAYRQTLFHPYSVICTQFGVLDFLLLSPHKSSIDQVINENQLQTILSGINIALSSSRCSLPIFVQYGGPDRHLYFGTCQNSSVRTTFESAQLRAPLPIHNHLEGLTKLFCEKLNILDCEEDMVIPSVFFEYVLKGGKKKKKHFRFSYDEDFISMKNLLLMNSTLPFGAPMDVLDEMYLCIEYPENTWISEDLYRSNISPLRAPIWIINASFLKEFPCLMHLCLKMLVDATKSDEGKMLVSKLVPYSNSSTNALDAFSPLISSSPSISITNIGGDVDGIDYLTGGKLLCWIDAIFLKREESSCNEYQVSSADVQLGYNAPGNAVREYGTCVDLSCEENEHIRNVRATCKDHINRCKAAPTGSLTERVAIALTHALSLHKFSTTAFAQLWRAFVDELRNYWQNNLLLPGFKSNEFPNFSTCEFHQKLQMLQCCINTRLTRFKTYESLNFPSQILNNTDFDDDEFFDAVEQQNEDISSCYNESFSYAQFSSSSDSTAPKGRKCQCEGLYLLNNPVEPIYEPFIQDRRPMTEAMLEEYSNYLLSLDERTRSRAQLDVLLSDMQAFKAANPGCVFEDFIRWHSPKDYVVDVLTNSGCLSSRMTGENPWTETWIEATAIPVHLQKRLFNETKEAESILEEFSNFCLSDIIGLIMPVVMKCALAQLVNECEVLFNALETNLLSLSAKIFHYTKGGDFDDLINILQDFEKAETAVAKYNAIWERLNNTEESPPLEKTEEVRKFVVSLLQVDQEENDFKVPNNETNVRGGVKIHRKPFDNSILSIALENLFFRSDNDSDDDSSLEKIETKEISSLRKQDERRHYTMHCLARRPSQGSRPTVQRLYALLSREEFRICSSFSEDTILN
ncbi:unnamed protein product [Dracunculus medinensis]|uniref:Rab3 GTPase-activating protein catalytic subunit n=1 Tax=Dracunculus medinensis TaxID=318479 RepID=A0A0N4U6R2_DRAME|nr:unnamed protein product [Dracunculus medinensis]